MGDSLEKGFTFLDDKTREARIAEASKIADPDERTRAVARINGEYFLGLATTCFGVATAGHVLPENIGRFPYEAARAALENYKSE